MFKSNIILLSGMCSTEGFVKRTIQPCKFRTIYNALFCLQREPSDLEQVETVHPLKYHMNNH